MPEPFESGGMPLGRPEPSLPRRGAAGPGPFSVDDDPFGASMATSITEDAPAAVVSVASLLRRKWTIVVVAMVVAGVSLPAIWTQVKPEYKSTATVQISPVRPKILYSTDSNGMPPIYQNFLNTQVGLILSPTVLQRVLDREDVKATPWYTEKARSLLGSPPSHMERLGKDIQVMPRGDTELIDVSMSAVHTGDAAVIVNAVVKEYETVSNDLSKEAEQARLSALKKAMVDVQEDIDRLVEEKFTISGPLGTVAPEEVRSQKASDLARAKAELDRLRIDESVAKLEIERTKQNAGNGQSGTAAMPSQQFVSDLTWRRDNDLLKSARNRLELAKQQFGPSHPRIKQLQTEVSQAETTLGETERRLAGAPLTVPDHSNGAVASANPLNQMTINSELRDMRKREMEKLIDRLSNEVQAAGGIARTLAKLEEKIGEKTRLREDIRNELQRQEMEREAPGRISIPSLGIATALPTRDRRPLFSVLAVGFALIAGMGAGYVRSLFDTNIYETKDVSNVVSAPFLGKIPRVRNPLAGAEDPSSELPLREAIRMVRTALLKRLAGVKGPAMLVTSPGASAGKTTMTILLGRSLARLGKKVLVVDADLRQPALSWTFEAGGQPGLRDVLAGEFREEDVVQRPAGNGFTMLPAGTFHGDGDAELLANGVLSAAIQRWKSNYDVVLIDSPPILPVADARILAGHADGTVMVLRASHCRRSEAVEAYAELAAAGARLLGSVLVGATESLAAYPYHYAQGGGDRKKPKLLA